MRLLSFLTHLFPPMKSLSVFWFLLTVMVSARAESSGGPAVEWNTDTQTFSLEGGFHLSEDQLIVEEEGKEKRIPRSRLRSLNRVPPPEDDLLSVPEQRFPKSRNTFLPYKGYPESLLVSFDVPEGVNLNVVPFSSKNGSAVENTFRLRVQGHWLKLMKPSYEKFGIPDPVSWNGQMPSRVGEHLNVMVHFDRKQELCSLYLDQQLVSRWFVRPTETAHPGFKVGATVRANRSDGSLRNFRVSTRSLEKGPPPSLGFSSEHDLLLLQNGDQLEVQVLSLDSENVKVELQGGHQVPLPLERIRKIHFKLMPAEQVTPATEEEGQASEESG